MSTLLEGLKKVASENPELRSKLVPLIKEAMEFPTEEAKKKYLQEHPGADSSNHTVKKNDESSGGKRDEGKGKKRELEKWELTPEKKELANKLESHATRLLSKIKEVQEIYGSEGDKTTQAILKGWEAGNIPTKPELDHLLELEVLDDPNFDLYGEGKDTLVDLRKDLESSRSDVAGYWSGHGYPVLPK